MSGKYDDMLYMPHHVSPTRPHMSAVDRGAQFSPFAALVGYDAVIAETARLTQERIELTESAQQTLNEKLRFLGEQTGEPPNIVITFFQQDLWKDGGKYVTVCGTVRRIDPVTHRVLMADGTLIPMEDILTIEGDCFASIPF